MQKEKFLQFLEHEKRYSVHTLKSYSTDLEQFIQFLSSEFQVNTVENINFQFVRSWIARLLSNNISTRSVNRKITTLKTYFRFLLQENIIKQSPMQKIISPKTSKRLPVFVEEIKMDELLNQIDFGEGFLSQRDRLILELFYFTGIRLSELINLPSETRKESASLSLVDISMTLQSVRPILECIVPGSITKESPALKITFLFSALPNLNPTDNSPDLI